MEKSFRQKRLHCRGVPVLKAPRASWKMYGKSVRQAWEDEEIIRPFQLLGQRNRVRKRSFIHAGGEMHFGLPDSTKRIVDEGRQAS
jgi:hypothetical protein